MRPIVSETTGLPVYEFGPFSIDPAKRILRRNGEIVALTGKALDLLLVLVSRAGEIVDKDELLRQVWPDTIVEENNLVRHVSMIRKALNDNLTEHLYIVTIAGRGYRFVAPVFERPIPLAPEPAPVGREGADPVDIDAPPGSAPPAAQAGATTDSARTGRVRLLMAAIATSLILAAAAAFWMRSRDAGGGSNNRTFGQVTFDSGYAGSPAWSPDGQSIAYTSDRSGNADIWVQSIGGGAPARITNAPEADDQPSWSPDGSLIAFRSEREGGGLYLVSASGGVVRRIAGFGYRPRWSPDGRHLLFISSTIEIREAPKAYLVPAGGGTPREILAGLLPAFSWPHLAWHPDGRRISIWGHHRQSGWSLFTVRLDDESSAVASDVSPPVREEFERLAVRFGPFSWSPSGRALYFTGASRGTSSVWRIAVDGDTLRWTGGPERLTTGPGVHRNVAVSRDGKRLAFIIQNERTRLWSLPFDPVAGAVIGQETTLTSAGADASAPAISRDGSRLAYRVVRGAREELWQRSLRDGREQLLVSGEGYPVFDAHWSPDGAQVAYRRGGLTSTNGGDGHAVALLSLARNEERLLTTPGSGATAQDWSPDGLSIVGRCAAGASELSRLCVFAVDAAPTAERSARVIAADGRFNVWQGRFSPDGRWVTFNAIRPAEAEISTIYVAPSRGGPWAQITEGRSFDDKARWAPDGRTIYFVSNRGTSLNVWGRRFDPARGEPVGEPFVVTSFGAADQMLLPQMGPLGLAIARDRLVITVTNLSANVWTLDDPSR